jgi:glycosyltransferase involved in cell wall biosynthesis
MVKRLETLGLTDSVEFCGFLTDPGKKFAMIARAKVLLLPSHDENWSIVIGEALACGTQVVAYDLEQIRPIWGDRVNWIREGDIQTFANSVIGLASKPLPSRYDMSSFDWGAIADEEQTHIRAGLRSFRKQ